MSKPFDIDYMERIEDALGWAATNLSWLKGSSKELTGSGFIDGAKEVIKEILDIHEPLEILSRGSRMIISSNGRPLPKIGDIEISTDLDADQRKWLESKFEEIENIWKELVELALERGDITEFPKTIRDRFIPSMSRIKKRNEPARGGDSTGVDSIKDGDLGTSPILDDFAAR